MYVWVCVNLHASRARIKHACWIMARKGGNYKTRGLWGRSAGAAKIFVAKSS